MGNASIPASGVGVDFGNKLFQTHKLSLRGQAVLVGVYFVYSETGPFTTLAKLLIALAIHALAMPDTRTR